MNKGYKVQLSLELSLPVFLGKEKRFRSKEFQEGVESRIMDLLEFICPNEEVVFPAKEAGCSTLICDSRNELGACIPVLEALAGIRN